MIPEYSVFVSVQCWLMVTYPDIRDLQMLQALAQRRHFTQAAADCGISQPAFSARIRHLEQMLGVPIVRRGNKFLGFTKDGELLLKWASKILADAEGLRQEMEVSKGELRGALVLGVVPTALSYASKLSTELREANPGLSIRIQSLTSLQILRGLADFSIDAGITYKDDGDSTAFRFDVIYDEHYVLLSPLSFSPRQKGTATWAEAAKVPLCLLSKDMHFRQIVDRVFSQAEVNPMPVMETNSFTAALAQVAIGSSATIAPSHLADSLLLEDSVIKLTLTKPDVRNAIGLCVLDQEPILPAIAALRQVVHSHDN